MDLVDDYLTSTVVRQMHLYAEMAGTQNPVTRACEALRRGDPAVVESSALPREAGAEFFDPHERVYVRVRLQRGHAPDVVEDDRPPEPQEPTVATEPMEVDE